LPRFNHFKAWSQSRPVLLLCTHCLRVNATLSPIFQPQNCEIMWIFQF
jgi:hypothetical protein